MNEPIAAASEPTAVDDVRRVRERLRREACGDLRKLAEASARVVEEYRQRLGLKNAKPPPPRPGRSDGTSG